MEQTPLFERLGGRDGVHAVVEQTIQNHLANPVIQTRFQHAPMTTEEMVDSATEFFCTGLSGVATYEGRSLADAHAGMNVSEEEFLAAIDDIVNALQSNGVGQLEQSRGDRHPLRHEARGDQEVTTRPTRLLARGKSRAWLIAAAASAATLIPATAFASPHPSVHPDGHGEAARTVDGSILDASLECTIGGNSDLDPVLLIHGATVEPAENFAWNYMRAFDDAGRTFCTVALPSRGNDDIQVAAEFVVHTIHAMHGRVGRTIDIVGWSEGGMIGRWATKYYPDTRRMVDDIVGLAPTNHGSNPVLCLGLCAPAFWQMRHRIGVPRGPERRRRDAAWNQLHVHRHSL